MPGLVPAEELQEVGFWLNLTNSGVVETTFELASVLAVLSVLDARSSVPSRDPVRSPLSPLRSALEGTRLTVVVIQLL